MSKPNQPTFNLKAVVRETGLKADTLRAWERRYGLPTPKRTAGGHRLYSQRDIDILKWLVNRQQEGLSISRAVEMWRRLENEGHNPLSTIPTIDQFNETPMAAIDAITHIRQAWLKACLAFDEGQANHLLAKTFALYPLELACIELLQKGLTAIGEGWFRGDISVQQEHFTTNLVVRWLETLIATTIATPRTSRILVGCPPNEEHVIASLMLSLFLRRQEYDVLYLGANIPMNHLVNTIQTTQTDLVVMLAQTLPTAAELLPVAQKLQTASVPLAFGGLIFNLTPQLHRHIPGYFLGEGLLTAVSTIEELLTTPATNALTIPFIPTDYHEALVDFRKNSTAINMCIEGLVPSSDPLYNNLKKANHTITKQLIAALILGNIQLLSPSLDWLLPAIPNRKTQLLQYLSLYHQVASTTLDEKGELILSWLNQTLAQNNVL